MLKPRKPLRPEEGRDAEKFAIRLTSDYIRAITDSVIRASVAERPIGLPPNRQENVMSQQSPNRILNALPQNIFVAVDRNLKQVDLRFGDVLAESVQPVDRVYFPTAGVVSLVVEMKVGDMIETAMVGRDGVANATAALDGKVSLHKAIVQVAGQASAIAPDSLRSLTDACPPFRSILIRHEQVVLAQAQQSAGCNASHTVEARMCR